MSWSIYYKLIFLAQLDPQYHLKQMEALKNVPSWITKDETLSFTPFNILMFQCIRVMVYILSHTIDPYPSQTPKVIPGFFGVHIALLSSFLCGFFFSFICVLCAQCCRCLWIVHSWHSSIFSNIYFKWKHWRMFRHE
jgi:hypothetical protein